MGSAFWLLGQLLGGARKKSLSFRISGGGEVFLFHIVYVDLIRLSCGRNGTIVYNEVMKAAFTLYVIRFILSIIHKLQLTYLYWIFGYTYLCISLLLMYISLLTALWLVTHVPCLLCHQMIALCPSCT